MALRPASLPDEPGLRVGLVDQPGCNSQIPVSAIATIGKRAQPRDHVRCRDLEKQNAREAARLQTRERHSALTAMRLSRRECKRVAIYPHYSALRVSSPPLATLPEAIRLALLAIIGRATHVAAVE